MQLLLNRMLLLERNMSEGNLAGVYAAQALVNKYGARLELKVWRYASRLIMEQS